MRGNVQVDLTGKIGEFCFLKVDFLTISTFKTDLFWVRLGIAEAHAKRRGRLCVVRADIHKDSGGSGAKQKMKKKLVKKMLFFFK